MRNKYLYWAPRVLGILLVLFLSMFAIDVFLEYSGWVLLLALVMHLIPSFVLIGLLVVAWKWGKIGGWLFIGLSVVFTIFFKTYQDIIVFLLISGPVLLVGVLFLFSDKYNQKRK